MKRRDFLAGMGMAAAAPAWANEGAALAADLPLLKRIYDTLHPGLLRYQTQAQWDAACEDAARRLRRQADVGQQYLAMAGLVSRIRCGHTYGNFYNQSKAMQSRLIAPANKLPFHFTWLGQRMVVTANPLGIDGLRRGCEIVAVNGVTARRIHDRMLPYVRADGSNDDKRRALLGVQGIDRIETFDVLYPLVFPHEGDFALDVADGGVRRTLRVAAIDQAQREGMMPSGFDPSTPDYWTLSWPRPQTALITMPGWALYNQTWDWKARIQAMFEEIASRGVTSLIIDLRDNEGGEDCGHEIIAHLIDREFPLFQDYEQRVRYRTTPRDLDPYLDTWDDSFRTAGEGAEDIGGGFYRIRNEDDADQRAIAPKGPRFTGKVIVLSGPQNSSATFQFIDMMRRGGLARIYGGPTGGNQRGINGGYFFFVRLPNSGLECDLPLKGAFPKTPKPDAGLLPDVRIEATIGNIAAGRDPVLQRALADLA